MAAERYTVEHETRYTYRAAVSQSWQLAHLTPRALPWQNLLAHEIKIHPAADERRDQVDCFGNPVTHFSLHSAHKLLRVHMSCEVEVDARPLADELEGASGASPVTWEDVRASVRGTAGHVGQLADLGVARMCEATPLVPWSASARSYAAVSLGKGRPWLEAVRDLMHRIHVDFAFEPGATTVTTSVDEVLKLRSGVCQDFAHVMLACLRGWGLPARYMSGYLLTRPPPGRARLLGADATHAWVAAYSPVHGWVEFDPTNDTHADRRYITLAWGGEFADVVPLRGVILGGRGHDLDVEVSVIPAAERV